MYEIEEHNLIVPPPPSDNEESPLVSEFQDVIKLSSLFQFVLLRINQSDVFVLNYHFRIHVRLHARILYIIYSFSV